MSPSQRLWLHISEPPKQFFFRHKIIWLPLGSVLTVLSFRRSALRDPIKLRCRADDQAPPRDRRRGHAHFVQRILAQQLVLLAGLNHKRVAVFAQTKYLSVVSPRR